jgi:hypothetical protein
VSSCWAADPGAGGFLVLGPDRAGTRPRWSCWSAPWALLEDKVRVAERELVAFRDGSEILNTLGRDRYVQGLGVRSDAVDDVLHALNSAAQRPDPSKVDFLAGAWASMRVPEKRKELRSAIDAVFLCSASGRQIQDRALVIPNGEGPDDLPRRGRRVPFAPFVWPPDSASSS